MAAMSIDDPLMTLLRWLDAAGNVVFTPPARALRWVVGRRHRDVAFVLAVTSFGVGSLFPIVYGTAALRVQYALVTAVAVVVAYPALVSDRSKVERGAPDTLVEPEPVLMFMRGLQAPNLAALGMRLVVGSPPPWPPWAAVFDVAFAVAMYVMYAPDGPSAREWVARWAGVVDRLAAVPEPVGI